MTSHPSSPPVSPADPNLQRLQRMSRLLATACWVLIVTLPPLFAWFWAVAPPALLASRVNLQADIVQGSLLLWQRVVGGCISAVPLGLLLAGLWQARKCFVFWWAGLHAPSGGCFEAVCWSGCGIVCVQRGGQHRAVRAADHQQCARQPTLGYWPQHRSSVCAVFCGRGVADGCGNCAGPAFGGRKCAFCLTPR